MKLRLDLGDSSANFISSVGLGVEGGKTISSKCASTLGLGVLGTNDTVISGDFIDKLDNVVNT